MTTIASSETLRWTACVTKRGQRGLLQRTDVTIPRTMLTVSRTSAVTPEARARYQSSVGCSRRGPASLRAPSSARANRRRGRRGRRDADEPGRAAARSASQSHASSPRTIAAVVAMLASTHVRRRRRSPSASSRRRCARRRVDDVMQLFRAAAPAAHGRARRRQATDSIATVSPGSSGPAAWSSVTRTAHPPSGASPATAMSPPRLDEDAAADPRNGSRRLPGRRRAPSRSRRGRARRRPGRGPCPRRDRRSTARQPANACDGCRSARGGSVARSRRVADSSAKSWS